MKFTRALETLTLSIVAALALATQPLHALQCGDTIVANTKLNRNLGPCPGFGLIIAASNVTLDLNGHTITGTPNGAGVLISFNGGVPFSGVTIKGPGTIASFQFGVLIQPSLDAMVYGLTLAGNATGIQAGNLTVHVRVLNNTIIGKNRQTVGVEVASSVDDHIYNNLILGHAYAVSLGMDNGAFVGSNVITQNTVGISADFLGCLNIRGNEVTYNGSDGIQLSAFGVFPAATAATSAAVPIETCASSPTVQGNTVKANGGNGILLDGPITVLVEDNIVSANSISGIAVRSYPGGLSGSSQVIGNFLSGNGTDLSWDGIGTGNCWHRNIFKTRTQALPDCQ